MNCDNFTHSPGRAILLRFQYMAEKRHKRQRLKKRLFTKNRLVILNEDTFAEVFSLRLTLMNVFVVASVGAVLIIFVTTLIIAFTPLREYIPGYASTGLREKATDLALKSDSLAQAVRQNEAYIASIRKILTDDLDYAHLSKDSIRAAEPTETSDLPASEAELELRRQVDQEDKYNLFEKARPITGLVLFAPVKGHLNQKYNEGKRHYGVDVAVTQDTPVKSVAGGTVIFADWTPSAGHVAIIRHRDGVLSVYKNCSSLMPSEGDMVRTGEVIGVAGSHPHGAGGTQLHFELWKDGHPIDPTQFIEFE